MSDDLESNGLSQTPESDGSSSDTETYVEERKRQLIDSIVSNVTQWLLTMVDSYRKSAGDNSSGALGKSDESLPSSSKAKSSDVIKPNNQKRKLTQTDDGETDAEDDDEGHKGDRQNGKKPMQNCENRKTEEACPLGEMEHVEGFGAAQERNLKSRKRPGAELSEIDKWRRVFKILFPHVLDDDIPSPFYEYDNTCQRENNHRNPGSDYLAQCEDYMVKEVPQRLRQALGRELDRDLTIVEESLRRKAGDWVKTLLEEAFREIRQNQGPSQPLGMNGETGLVIERPNLQAGSSESSNLLETEGWPDLNLDSFDPFQFLGETEFAFDNGGLLEDLLRPEDSENGKTTKVSDSGYSSFNPAEFTK
ncbi:hypothetical protein ACHAPU_009912 [Fusarium lateritium]